MLCSFSFVFIVFSVCNVCPNVVAHRIAKLSFSMEELRVWLEEVPLDIVSSVIADITEY